MKRKQNRNSRGSHVNRTSLSAQGSVASATLAPALGQSRTVAIFRTTLVVFLGSAFVAICSHISAPLWFTPVPLTLQPFAVLMIGLLLSPRLAAATLFTYLAEGAAGLPVFATGFTFTAGFAHLFGPTGGYLLAYPASAYLIAALWRPSSHSFWNALSTAAVGDLVILAGGALWLSAFTHATLGSLLSLAVLPFVPGDVLKVAAAAAIASGWSRFRSRNQAV